MHVANLELCKELYELSGWESGQWSERWEETEHGEDFVAVPQYDLGFLLRKLNEFRPDVSTSLYVGGTNIKGDTKHTSAAYKSPYRANAGTPEDAACKLCIELFRQGVLTKEDDGTTK